MAYIDDKMLPNQKNHIINESRLKTLTCKQNMKSLEVYYCTDLLAIIDFENSKLLSISFDCASIHPFKNVLTEIDGDDVNIVTNIQKLVIPNVMSSDRSTWLGTFLKTSYKCLQYDGSTL